MIERVLTLRTFIVFFAMVIITRLYFICIVSHDELYTKAKNQNTVNISVSAGRNDFLDRHNRHITGVEKKGYIAIFSSKDEELDKKNCDILECYTYETSEKIYKRLKENGKTFVETNVDLEDVDVDKFRYLKKFNLPSRYLNDYPAASLVGYVSDNKGVYGLERVYDEYLLSTSKGATVNIDAFRNMIGDMAYAGNSGSEKVKLTLDLTYQRIVEDCLKASDNKCSAVLLDVESFDLLAMASYPTFKQDRIGAYLDNQSGVLQNNSMLAYDMGSIFKIVVVAAASENNLLDTEKLYNCLGKMYVAGKEFECHNAYGHGWQNIYDAFKNSCNCAFIELGTEVGYKNILDMAKKFGLGNKNLYPLELEQQKGMLPDENNYYLADLSNLSIGQGKLSGTVLDGAILSAVIAGNGFVKNVNCAECITDSYGQTIKNLKSEKSEKILTDYTADIIKSMMCITNKSGTGTNAQIEDGGSGGKTGSAQTGWYVDGENYQHGWFTGFFPEENPKFALCVFVENGKSGSESAAPIFKKIGDRIMELKRG